MNIDGPTSFGELLQKLRKQKKIRQQVLADKLGVHRNTIGAWERGDRLPDTRGIIVELAKELRLDEEEKRQFLEASQMTLSSYWSVPYPRNPFFTGRHAFLETLHQRLRAESSTALSQCYALSGLGGIGKTQLALEYVYLHALAYYATFWIVADTLETLYSGFATIASQLQLPECAEQEAEKVVHAVLHWLNTHKGWLLIFDNVVSVALLKPFLPIARRGAVLLTTQLRTLEDLSYILELPPLPSDEGVQLLLHRAKLINPLARSETLLPNLAEAALALVEALGGLPLAIDQAGAYIERTGCGLQDYLHLFEHHQISLLGERSEMAHHPTSVVKTFQLSFEQIAQENEAAADLLRICAFLAPDAIPEELFTKGMGSLGSSLGTRVTDAYQFNQVLGEALRYSLLSRQPQNQTLSMHRLVQAVLQNMLSEEEWRIWAERAVLAINAAFPGVEHSTWPQCERLLPHALVCAVWIEHAPIPALEASCVLHKAGTYLEERGQYSEAEPLLVRALAICEQQLGAEHPETASTLNNLGRLYRHLGRYSEAEPLFQRAILIREQQLGVDHPETASTLNNLAALYSYQGKYSEAGSLFQRALTICEQQLGTEHPETALSLNGLARTYCDRGKYCEAEPLFQYALSIQEQYLGTEHPLTARSLNNLGELYYKQGKYCEAEVLYERALAIFERQLGTEHPFTATTLNGLACTYCDRGKYGEAEALFQRALSIREQQLGAEHPDTANSLHRLAELYQHQGQYERAEAFYQRALSIREQQLGAEHPFTADSLDGLADLFQYQGEYCKAESFYKRVLAIREQRLGSTHPKTQKTRVAYAALLCLVGRDTEAAVLVDTGQKSSIEG